MTGGWSSLGGWLARMERVRRASKPRIGGGAPSDGSGGLCGGSRGGPCAVSGRWVARTSPDGGSVLRLKWKPFASTDGQAALDARSIKILQLHAAWKLAARKAHT